VLGWWFGRGAGEQRGGGRIGEKHKKTVFSSSVKNRFGGHKIMGKEFHKNKRYPSPQSAKQGRSTTTDEKEDTFDPDAG